MRLFGSIGAGPLTAHELCLVDSTLSIKVMVSGGQGSDGSPVKDFIYNGKRLIECLCRQIDSCRMHDITRDVLLDQYRARSQLNEEALRRYQCA